MQSVDPAAREAAEAEGLGLSEGIAAEARRDVPMTRYDEDREDAAQERERAREMAQVPPREDEVDPPATMEIFSVAALGDAEARAVAAESKMELLETAWRSRGFVCQWAENGDLVLVTLGGLAIIPKIEEVDLDTATRQFASMSEERRNAIAMKTEKSPKTNYPPRYRPSLRLSDGLYEIFLYPDDPAWKAALEHLTKRAPYALSNGRAFIGRPEDYALFEAAIAPSDTSAADPHEVPGGHR
jgi:hypothetical protein